MKNPVIETERLILRPLTMDDAQTAFDTWASDPEVAKYMRYYAHKSVDTTKEWLKSVVANENSDTDYDWGFVLKETGKLIGSGGIYYDDEELDGFAGRDADGYTAEEEEQWRDVLYTLQPGDLLGWGQSIKHRGLVMPASIQAEFLQLAAENRR